MSGKSINFGDKKINRSDFYKNKKLFKIDDRCHKILVSKKESYGKKNPSKYFIGYSDGDNVIRLCIKLPQMIGYVKHFDSLLRLSISLLRQCLLRLLIMSY